MTKWYPTTYTANYNDKHARHLLPDFPPGSYVCAKPLPNSQLKAWVLGQITGSAGPRSHYIITSTEQIRRNHVQMQLAPPLNNVEQLPETNTNLPDKLRSFFPNPTSSFVSLAAPAATPNDVSPSLVSSAAPIAAPNDVSPSSGPLPKSAPDTLIPPCLHNLPISNVPSQLPSQPAPQVVTRSG